MGSVAKEMERLAIIEDFTFCFKDLTAFSFLLRFKIMLSVTDSSGSILSTAGTSSAIPVTAPKDNRKPL